MPQIPVIIACYLLLATKHAKFKIVVPLWTVIWLVVLILLSNYYW